MNFGLTPTVLDQLRQVFTATPAVDKVVVYGSRARGDYRHNSDIDLTVYGSSLTFDDQLRLDEALDDLLLPYKIDLSLFHHLDNADLIEEIERTGRVLYERGEEAVKAQVKQENDPTYL